MLNAWLKKERDSPNVTDQHLQRKLETALKQAELLGFVSRKIDFKEARRASVAEAMRTWSAQTK